MALGAHVTLLAPRLDQLRAMEDRWPGRLTTLPSTLANTERAIVGADVLISGVLVKGGSEAPQLVSREDLRSVGHGAVIVDVLIDQGGIFETSRPTRHADPSTSKRESFTIAWPTCRDSPTLINRSVDSRDAGIRTETGGARHRGGTSR